MEEDRPLCKCHGEPMRKAGRGGFRCAVKSRERNKKWKEKNRERVRYIAKKYYEKNKKRIDEYSKKWREENRELYTEQKRELYKRRRDAGRCVQCGGDNSTLGAYCTKCRPTADDKLMCYEGIKIPELPEDAKLKCLL